MRWRCGSRPRRAPTAAATPAPGRASLAIAPGVAQHFELETPIGEPICTVGDSADIGDLPLVAPGDIRLRVAPDERVAVLRVGVIGGMATDAPDPRAELRSAALDSDGGAIREPAIRDGAREIA